MKRRDYQRLENYLQSQKHRSKVRLSFSEIAKIIGSPTLPKSAYTWQAWWANQTDTTRRAQARAWTKAGFKVESLHQSKADGWVEFAKVT